MSTSNLGQIPADNGALSTFSNSSATLTGSEDFKISFRLPITVEPNSNSEKFTAFTIPVDSTIQSSFLDGFEYYSFSELTLDLHCTAPLGTASGAMHVAYFSDPLNADVPKTLALAEAKFGATDGSVVIRPRDSKQLLIPIGNNPVMSSWRYVRADQSVRLSSFGTIVGITVDPPAAGDGTVYKGWLHGYAHGKRRTQNTGGSVDYARYSGVVHSAGGATWDYEVGCPYYELYTDIFLPADCDVSVLLDRVVTAPIHWVGNDDKGQGKQATIVTTLSAFNAVSTVEGRIRFLMYYPEIPALGFVPEGLLVDRSQIMKDLAATPWSVKYQEYTARDLPTFDKFLISKNKRPVNKVVNNKTHKISNPPTASSSTFQDCVISGRPAAPLRRYSTFTDLTTIPQGEDEPDRMEVS